MLCFSKAKQTSYFKNIAVPAIMSGHYYYFLLQRNEKKVQKNTLDTNFFALNTIVTFE